MNGERMRESAMEAVAIAKRQPGPGAPGPGLCVPRSLRTDSHRGVRDEFFVLCSSCLVAVTDPASAGGLTCKLTTVQPTVIHWNCVGGGQIVSFDMQMTGAPGRVGYSKTHRGCTLVGDVGRSIPLTVLRSPRDSGHKFPGEARGHRRFLARLKHAQVVGFRPARLGKGVVLVRHRLEAEDLVILAE